MKYKLHACMTAISDLDRRHDVRITALEQPGASAVEPVGSDLALYRVDVRAEHYSATPLREVLGRDPVGYWRTKHDNTTMHLYERT